MDQFMQHCERYTLLQDYQSAYRENYSCETVLIGLVNDILLCMDNKAIPTLVTTDLSAAFDKVDHSFAYTTRSSRTLIWCNREITGLV